MNRLQDTGAPANFADAASVCCHGQLGRCLVPVAFGLGWLLAGDLASAQAVDDRALQVSAFPISQVVTFLFLMLGPFKIIGPFTKATRSADVALTRKIAINAIIFSTIALLVAMFLAEAILGRYNIPIAVLALAAGIILFLVALQGILTQFVPPAPHDEKSDAVQAPPSMQVALMPIAFPTIVTPYGIAAIVVFLALSPDLPTRLAIGGVVLALMAINLVVMLLARQIGTVLGALLVILGAVLGVIQVALGLQIIGNSLRAMGILH